MKEMYFAIVSDGDILIGWEDTLNDMKAAVADWYNMGYGPEADYSEICIYLIKGINCDDFNRMANLNEWCVQDCRATLIGYTKGRKPLIVLDGYKMQIPEG